MMMKVLDFECFDMYTHLLYVIIFRPDITSETIILDNTAILSKSYWIDK